MKKCSKCGEAKELTEFGKSKFGKGGLQSSCKSCIKEYKKEYREKNKEAIKNYREKNKEATKEHREKNKEAKRKYDKEYREENKEMLILSTKKYREQNKEAIKNYREENKEAIKNYSKTPKGKYSRYKVGAKTRGYSFNLTFKEFKSYWQKDCSYCGDPIETIGLDRVDNTKGYSIDNIVSCCKVCNVMKMNHTELFMRENMIKMLKHRYNMDIKQQLIK